MKSPCRAGPTGQQGKKQPRLPLPTVPPPPRFEKKTRCPVAPPASAPPSPHPFPCAAIPPPPPPHAPAPLHAVVVPPPVLRPGTPTRRRRRSPRLAAVPYDPGGSARPRRRVVVAPVCALQGYTLTYSLMFLHSTTNQELMCCNDTW
jgi:hypothetical protein